MNGGNENQKIKIEKDGCVPLPIGEGACGTLVLLVFQRFYRIPRNRPLIQGNRPHKYQRHRRNKKMKNTLMKDWKIRAADPHK